MATTSSGLLVPPSTLIEEIFICNTTSGAVTCQLCIDTSGVVYTQATAILWDYSIAANDFKQIRTRIILINPAANIAFRTASGSALTIQIFGEDR